MIEYELEYGQAERARRGRRAIEGLYAIQRQI